MNLQDAQELDAADPLAPLRELFSLPEGVIYLDGNSLGAMPRATLERVARAVEGEWGKGLISSWNTAGWMDLPQRVGDKIAQLIGAKPGEVVATDSTSVNLYKVLHCASQLQLTDAPSKRIILTEIDNFPTDLYIAQSVCEQLGFSLRAVKGEDIEAAITNEVAIVMLTHTNYRTGRIHNMPHITARAHVHGALTVWDLAHSAGAMEVDLHAVHADFAIGCGYKYLNGGPGAPAFVWMHPRHASRARQPLSGWLGHAKPFDFSHDYAPASGITRFMCGTPPILSLTALDCGLDTLLAALPHGGMAALRKKSVALTEMFIAQVESRCAGFDLTLVSPRESAQRGSQVSFTHPTQGYAIIQALIARGVVDDFRAPDILRFGFTPLYTRYEDVWQAIEALLAVLQSREYLKPEFQQRKAVT
jgi:kynureninase